MKTFKEFLIEENFVSKINGIYSKVKSIIASLADYKEYSAKNKKKIDELTKELMGRIINGETITADNLIKDLSNAVEKDKELQQVNENLSEDLSDSIDTALKDLRTIFMSFIALLQVKGVLTALQKTATDDPSKLHAIANNTAYVCLGAIVTAMVIVIAVMMHLKIKGRK